MNTYTQILLGNRTTAGAQLRGAGGVHGHDLRTGALSQGQVVIGGHQLEREVFQGDQAAGVHQLAGRLVPDIAALVGDVLVQAGDWFGSRFRAWVGYRLYVRIIRYRPFCTSM